MYVLTTFIIYADETTMFASNKALHGLTQIIHDVQDVILNGFSANKLICYQSKTQNIELSHTQKHLDHSR